MADITTKQTSKGTAYVVKWRPQSGTFKEKTFYVKREAERHRDKVERELDEDNSTEHLAGRSKTFRQAAEAMIAASAHLKQKTLDGYEIALRVHAYPAFGNRRISTLKAADIDDWLATIRAKPKANGEPRTETSVLGTQGGAEGVLRRLCTPAHPVQPLRRRHQAQGRHRGGTVPHCRGGQQARRRAVCTAALRLAGALRRSDRIAHWRSRRTAHS